MRELLFNVAVDEFSQNFNLSAVMGARPRPRPRTWPWRPRTWLLRQNPNISYWPNQIHWCFQ